ncbi:MAG TPA: NAD(P)/FAD-dependent oxidoreductase [Caldithrix abyssi]|uniref:NAD(P)/FAD-dependent oxidoreductase n=1 Tax=Caldithrix abyssi TaxID=187145 RepID=A0A7V4WW40_CALAY|nr:NAD(P)/FAD-dependent oxidoreductase [Caldithrix abyssi]
MAKIVVIGAGFAGHTAALYLGDALGKKHEVTVVNKREYFLFLPSLIWVSVNRMKPEKTYFQLKPVYDKMHVRFIHGSVKEVHPEENFLYAEKNENNEQVKLEYDYLLVATGPKLNFDGTEGLGPHKGTTYSVCTLDHTVETARKYNELVERMEKGEKLKIVAGVGHPAATCQGAAYEFITNVHRDLERRNLRDRAELVWLSNEPELGDFGVRGLTVKKGGWAFTSEQFIKMIYEDFGIKWEIGRGVKAVDNKKAYWEDLNGNEGETDFDFAMLIPQFTGVPIKYVGKSGEDVSEKVVNKAGFTLVDGIYGLPYETLAENPDAWPSVYQNPNYRNIFAAGIAFAPPGPISRPHKNPNGMVISPAPPRTGMVSGIIGRIVAKNIIDLIQKGRMTHQERMSEMFAACIASMGDSLWDGSAATMVLYPVVPDNRRYPNEHGRDMSVTNMEMGLAGAWMKRLIHTTFMHKFKRRIGWKIIPE